MILYVENANAAMDYARGSFQNITGSALELEDLPRKRHDIVFVNREGGSWGWMPRKTVTEICKLLEGLAGYDVLVSEARK